MSEVPKSVQDFAEAYWQRAQGLKKHIDTTTGMVRDSNEAEDELAAEMEAEKRASQSHGEGKRVAGDHMDDLFDALDADEQYTEEELEQMAVAMQQQGQAGGEAAEPEETEEPEDPQLTAFKAKLAALEEDPRVAEGIRIRKAQALAAVFGDDDDDDDDTK